MTQRSTLTGESNEEVENSQIKYVGCRKNYINEIQQLENSMLQLFVAQQSSKIGGIAEGETSWPLVQLNIDEHSMNVFYKENMGAGKDSLDLPQSILEEKFITPQISKK